MVRGGIYLVRPASPLGHVMAGSPVRWHGEGLAHTGAALMPIAPADVEPARLWLAKGKEWRGPFRSWRAARAALPWPSDVLGALAKAGRANPLGAETTAWGWRYRLAYAGAEPPERYGFDNRPRCHAMARHSH